MANDNLTVVQLQTTRLKLCTANSPEITAEALLALNEPNVDFWQPWGPILPANFLTIETQALRLQNDIEALQKGSSLRFFLLPNEDNNALSPDLPSIWGDVHFSNIVGGIFQSCYIGAKIHKPLAGKGYITEAAKAAIDYIFEIRQLHRIEATIMPNNSHSIHVTEKLGFVCEGLSRKYLKINGVWEDHLRYVMWNDNV